MNGSSEQEAISRRHADKIDFTKKKDGVAIQTRHAYELYMYCWF